MVEYRPLTEATAEMMAAERNGVPYALRTPEPSTALSQRRWYCEVATGPNERWWEIVGSKAVVGYGGIEKISWPNRTGEVSLLICKAARGKGYGTKAANFLVWVARATLGLDWLTAEVYGCNPGLAFWRRVLPCEPVMLKGRKWYDGHYWNSHVFVVDLRGHVSDASAPVGVVDPNL